MRGSHFLLLLEIFQSFEFFSLYWKLYFQQHTKTWFEQVAVKNTNPPPLLHIHPHSHICGLGNQQPSDCIFSPVSTFPSFYISSLHIHVFPKHFTRFTQLVNKSTDGQRAKEIVQKLAFNRVKRHHRGNQCHKQSLKKKKKKQSWHQFPISYGT